MDILDDKKKVVFESDTWEVPTFEPKDRMSRMARLVVEYSDGKIKNEKQATIVLVVMALVIFALSALIFISSLPPDVSRPNTSTEASS